jgi:competence ComEA-like helix-hairpin-helix protein
MKEFIKTYFTFNKRERNGILLLVLIVFILIIMINTMEYWYKPSFSSDFSEIKKASEYFNTGNLHKDSTVFSDIQNKPTQEHETKSAEQITKKPPQLINPNDATTEELVATGITVAQARIIKAFVAKGGVFSYKEDLMKIKTMNDSVYQLCEKWIDLPLKPIVAENKKITKFSIQLFSSSSSLPRDSEKFKGLKVWEYKKDRLHKFMHSSSYTKDSLMPLLAKVRETGFPDAFITTVEVYESPNLFSKNENHYSTQKENLIIEINSADTILLEKLKGVGPSFARRIYNYRESLGGFLQAEQIKEVYGMTDSLYLKILSQITIDKLLIKRININTCSKDELGKHPYIGWKKAQVIINYRDKHGPYKTTDEIKKTDLVSEELYRKIAAYIKTE